MGKVHPLHCASVFCTVVVIGCFAAGLILPWTHGHAWNADGSGTYDMDITMWEACVSNSSTKTTKTKDATVTVTTSGKQCSKFSDTLRAAENASACPPPQKSPNNHQVLLRIQVAEGSAIGALVLAVWHLLAITMYTFGTTRFRFPFLITGFMTLAAAANSLIWWSTYLKACDQSVCDMFTQTAVVLGMDSTCGASAGMWVMVGAAAVTFVCLFPLFLIPQAPRNEVAWTGYDPSTAESRPAAAFGTTGGYQPVYNAPATTNPGYYQPAPYYKGAY